MTYQHVWWVNNVEYGAGLNPQKTWPQVMDQYRRPNNARFYNLPTEQYTHKLYYEYPQMGMPAYRGRFRDKPHTINSHHPEPTMEKTRGFHGRMYYEHGRPQFKYDGPVKDELYWLERSPYLPSFSHSDPKSAMIRMCERGLNGKPLSTSQSARIASADGTRAEAERDALQSQHSYKPPSTRTLSASSQQLLGGESGSFRKITQDGVGYL